MWLSGFGTMTFGEEERDTRGRERAGRIAAYNSSRSCNTAAVQRCITWHVWHVCAEAWKCDLGLLRKQTNKQTSENDFSSAMTYWRVVSSRHAARDLFHVIRARCGAHGFHTIAPGPRERAF